MLGNPLLSNRFGGGNNGVSGVGVAVLILSVTMTIHPMIRVTAAFQQQQPSLPSSLSSSFIYNNNNNENRRKSFGPSSRATKPTNENGYGNIPFRISSVSNSKVVLPATANNNENNNNNNEKNKLGESTSYTTALEEVGFGNTTTVSTSTSTTGGTTAITSTSTIGSGGGSSGDIESVVELGIDWLENIRNNQATTIKNVNSSGILWRGVVVILCALWASNFAAIKLVTAEPGVDSSLYAVSRFGVAAISLTPFALSSARRSGMDIETIQGAVICGSWVAFGYLGQLIGLLTTTASRSCVICSLHCVFVAGIAEFIRSQKAENTQFDIKKLGPAVVAVIGVAVIELWGAGGSPTMGDLISFSQPIGFGMGYLQLEELMSRRPDTALPVSAIKLTIVAIASLLYFEIGPLLASTTTLQDFTLEIPDFTSIVASPLAMGGVLYTGLVTTSLALWVESIAFARVPATDASLILTTEPLFAATFGAISLGETFGTSDYIGATFIIGACILATLLDSNNDGDEECDPFAEDDPSCETPRTWPFTGGF